MINFKVPLNQDLPPNTYHALDTIPGAGDGAVSKRGSPTELLL